MTVDVRESAPSPSPSASAPAWFDAALAVEPRIGEVVVAGEAIATRTWGEPAATGNLLLVHGGGAHSRWWDFTAPLLATDRRVVAMDLSGHGDSGPRAAYSMDRWADEVAAVLATLGPQPVLAGHSLGGMVSTVLARRGPAELAGLIVIDSPIEPEGMPTRTEADSPSFGNARVYATEADVIARFRPIPPQQTLPYTADHVARTSYRAVPGGFSWKFDPAFVALVGQEPRSLDGLGCRVVYIAGERGILSATGRAAMQDSAEVQYLEVPDAGHAIMLDQPVALIAALRGVLAGWNSRA